MKENLERHLLNVLEKLDKATLRIQASQGYGRDVRRLRLLNELVKEQIRHEDPRSSTRAMR